MFEISLKKSSYHPQKANLHFVPWLWPDQMMKRILKVCYQVFLSFMHEIRVNLCSLGGQLFVHVCFTSTSQVLPRQRSSFWYQISDILSSWHNCTHEDSFIDFGKRRKLITVTSIPPFLTSFSPLSNLYDI